MDIMCPICHKKYHVRIADNLNKTHGIGVFDSNKLKDLLTHVTYFPRDQKGVDEIKKILADNHFKFENVRLG